MQTLANISQFESLQNGANAGMQSQMSVFNALKFGETPSGTGVFDEDSGKLVGMIIEKDGAFDTAFYGPKSKDTFSAKGFTDKTDAEDWFAEFYNKYYAS